MIPGTIVHANDQISGERAAHDSAPGGGYYGEPLQWDGEDPAERWCQWVVRTVIGRTSAAMHNLQDFAATPAAGR